LRQQILALAARVIAVEHRDAHALLAPGAVERLRDLGLHPLASAVIARETDEAEARELQAHRSFAQHPAKTGSERPSVPGNAMLSESGSKLPSGT
jgi:hypothetical protein